MIGRIKLAIGVPTLLMLCSSLLAADKFDPGLPATEDRIKTDIFFLASKECEGRGPTTQGLNRAADYIANQFKEAGLKPLAADGTYFQKFTISGTVLDGEAKLAFAGPEGKKVDLKAGQHFQPLGFTAGGVLKDAPIVFAGFGIKSKELKYNDYENLDVRDKLVVVLRDSPRAGKPDAKSWEVLASLNKKIQVAEMEGAAGIIFLNDAANAEDELMDFSWTAVRDQLAGKIPVYHLSRKAVEPLFEKTGKTLTDREGEIVKETKPASLELKDWTANGTIPAKFGKTLPLKNVIGVVEGNGPLANETVVVGAHYDHLGYGGAGGSAARVKKPVMHNGADDNASGTTAMLELARRLAAQRDRQGRRVVFMAFSGEELGLKGSDHYRNNPLLPLDKTVAMLNLDMVGRLPRDEKTGKDKLFVEGHTTAKEWPDLVQKLNEKHGFELKMDGKGIMPNSDHYSFYRTEKVPVLFFWTSYHSDYHRPTDTAEKINIVGMRKIVGLSEDVIGHLASTTTPPKWLKTNVVGGSASASGPKIGIMPGYLSGKEGVLIDDIITGRPADKGGLKKGDLIVEMAGKPIKGLPEYMAIMATQKVGTELVVVVLREDKKQTVKLKLE